jgi:hypothetical protein
MEIRPQFPDGEKCDFHPTRKAVPLEAVGRIIDPALRANYSIGEWMYDHQEGDDLYTLINETTGADEDGVIQGLISWLIDNDDYWPPDGEEPFYGEDQSYVAVNPDGWHHSMLWRRFRDEILHRQRFFNEVAKKFLSEIFDGIQHQADISNRPAFYRFDPTDGPEFFRARIIVGDAEYKTIADSPAAQMGPPPSHLRRAGRMNAAGIAVFYGALELDTAIAELRPAVGSLVCAAKFKLSRPIHVLDLTRFSRQGKRLDIFAKNQILRTEQWSFMQSFANEISKPILPSDEHLEYVPAQVVAEYLTQQSLRWHGSEIVPDGIIFHSAQRLGGNNIAVMGPAATVLADQHKSSEVDKQFQDDPLGSVLFEFQSPTSGTSNPALQYVENSIQCVEITSARYGTGDHFPIPYLTASDLDEDPQY